MAPLYTKGKKEILFLTTLWNGGELVSRTVDSSDGVHIHTFYLHMFNKYGCWRSLRICNNNVSENHKCGKQGSLKITCELTIITFYLENDWKRDKNLQEAWRTVAVDHFHHGPESVDFVFLLFPISYPWIHDVFLLASWFWFLSLVFQAP